MHQPSGVVAVVSVRHDPCDGVLEQVEPAARSLRSHEAAHDDLPSCEWLATVLASGYLSTRMG